MIFPNINLDVFSEFEGKNGLEEVQQNKTNKSKKKKMEILKIKLKNIARLIYEVRQK